MDLNVLLPGNRTEASTDNGTKNEGEQKSKTHHWEDVLCNISGCLCTQKYCSIGPPWRGACNWSGLKQQAQWGPGVDNEELGSLCGYPIKKDLPQSQDQIGCIGSQAQWPSYPACRIEKIARIAVENYNCLASLAREGVKKNLTPSSAPGLEIDCHGWRRGLWVSIFTISERGSQEGGLKITLVDKEVPEFRQMMKDA